MSSSKAPAESTSLERLAQLERQLSQLQAERDRLTHERAQLLQERDDYKSRAEWLHTQLERLRYEVKTPRERVDPRQIQLVFSPFAQALLGVPAQQALSTPQDTDADRTPDPPHPPNPKRKATPHGRRVLPEHLPVETIVLSPSPLPASAPSIGAEVSWRLGYRRAGYYRLRVVRPLYVVTPEQAAMSTEVIATWDEPQETAQAAPSPTSEAPFALDKETTTIAYAPAPEEMIARGLPTVDVLAHILVGKFGDKLPFHRQEGICAREGVPLTRSVMCGWAKGAHALAHHVVDAMIDDARAHAQILATDATGVLVQAKETCKKGHFWVYVADRDHVIFRYAAQHSSDEPKAAFQGFRGTVLSDASNVYDVLFGLPDSPGEANCWSHARRYFYKAIDSENREEALVGIGFCNELFELERGWKKLPPEKRCVMRKQRAGPVIAMLERWKNEQLESPRVAQGSRLRKALSYLTNQWPALCTFLENGRVPIHNNESERQLRALVIGRANWLFVGRDDTAPWTCTFVSLIASCAFHGLDPEGYLRDLFRVLPVWPKNRMLELAPKHWRATRERLNLEQLAMPLGPLSVPPARALRDDVARVESA